MNPISSVVMSIPPVLRGDLLGTAPVELTYDVFARLFASARRSLKILTPYVDPTFTSLLALTTAGVQVVTTTALGRGNQASPILERCAAIRNVKPRYLRANKGALMYQVHAKLLIADGERAYVGSANLTDTSIHYNLEMGLYIEDRTTVDVLERIFDRLYRQAVPASKL